MLITYVRARQSVVLAKDRLGDLLAISALQDDVSSSWRWTVAADSQCERQVLVVGGTLVTQEPFCNLIWHVNHL